MKHKLITFKDGRSEVHFDAPFNNDYTLCGHDTCGDLDWNEAQDTDQKVNCDHCMAIVAACKKVSKSEMER